MKEERKDKKQWRAQGRGKTCGRERKEEKYWGREGRREGRVGA